MALNFYYFTDFTYSGIGSGGNLELGIDTNTNPITNVVSSVVTSCRFTDNIGQYSNVGIITISEGVLNGQGIQTVNGNGINFAMNNSCLERVPTNKVQYIKMANIDLNGLEILPYIQNSSYVTFNLTQGYDYLNNIILGPQTWYIDSVGLQDDNDPSTTNAVLLDIFQPPSSPVISSNDVDFYDLSFSASGQFVWEATSSGVDPNVILDINLTSSIPQGYFPPVSTFPTESFFRGWGTSVYYQIDEYNNLFITSSGIGGSTDTFGNFNTGSVEMDTDATNTTSYTPPSYPWFMNATASTTQVLVASSTVGNLGQTDLQLYTGSITASSVPIGPVWNIYDPPTAVEIFPTFNDNETTDNIFINTLQDGTPAEITMTFELANGQSGNWTKGLIIQPTGYNGPNPVYEFQLPGESTWTTSVEIPNTTTITEADLDPTDPYAIKVRLSGNRNSWQLHNWKVTTDNKERGITPYGSLFIQNTDKTNVSNLSSAWDNNIGGTQRAFAISDGVNYYWTNMGSTFTGGGSDIGNPLRGAAHSTVIGDDEPLAASGIGTEQGRTFTWYSVSISGVDEVPDMFRMRFSLKQT